MCETPAAHNDWYHLEVRAPIELHNDSGFCQTFKVNTVVKYLH